MLLRWLMPLRVTTRLLLLRSPRRRMSPLARRTSASTHGSPALAHPLAQPPMLLLTVAVAVVAALPRRFLLPVVWCLPACSRWVPVPCWLAVGSWLAGSFAREQYTPLWRRVPFLGPPFFCLPASANALVKKVVLPARGK